MPRESEGKERRNVMVRVEKRKKRGVGQDSDVLRTGPSFIAFTLDGRGTGEGKKKGKDLGAHNCKIEEKGKGKRGKRPPLPPGPLTSKASFQISSTETNRREGKKGWVPGKKWGGDENKKTSEGRQTNQLSYD